MVAMMRRGLIILYVLLAATACASDGEEAAQITEEDIEMAIEISSPAFQEGAAIPKKYSCDGQDVSPALAWSNIPSGSQSLALIMDDPDAPAGTWVHWVVYDMPASNSGLPENVPTTGGVPGGGVQGNNSWKRSGYGGPCPPGGTHRYFFKLYALDKLLGLGPGATKGQVLKAMEGHVLDQGQLMGRYSR